VGDLSRLTFNAPPPKPEAQPVRHPVGAALRMIRWGWVLARHDALIPREANPLLPAWGRPARCLRLASI
jgi:ubiquinone biosynthesis protein